MGAELSCPHPGGRGARGQRREGQPEALLPGPPETGQVGGRRPGPLGTRGRVSGPMGRRWIFPPLVHGSVRPTTSGLSGLHVLLLKWERGHTLFPTPLSPKSRLGLHFPRSPPFLWASARRRAQAGSQLHWKPGCVGTAGGPYSGGQETRPPRRELQGPSLAAAISSLNKWESLAPGPFLTAALASAAQRPRPGAPPHSAAWAPGGPTCAHITPASLQTQAPAAAARGGAPGLHWV